MSRLIAIWNFAGSWIGRSAAFSSESPTAKERTRTYTKFSGMMDDMIAARIYQGIHFRFADQAGRELGEKVAVRCSARLRERT